MMGRTPVLSSFEDGACFVDLAPISDDAQVPWALAQAVAGCGESTLLQFV